MLSVGDFFLEKSSCSRICPYSLYEAYTFPSPRSRKGGPLAVTDANLLLGRLIPDFFPKIFGKTENQPLDVEASKQGFEALAQEVNSNFDKQLELDEVVYG